MTMLTKIGNSQGVRIPKALIEQANLEGARVKLELVEQGILIKPIKRISRDGWESHIQDVLAKNQNKEDHGFSKELLNDSDLEDFQW